MPIEIEVRNLPARNYVGVRRVVKPTFSRRSPFLALCRGMGT